MITRIGHVAFRITDLERSLRFYTDVLGFREAFRLDREGEPSPWIVYIQVVEGQFIELFPGATERGPLPGAAASYNHLCLEVDDMEATLRQLRERGLDVTGSPARGSDHNWQFWIEDPDGNRIELMQIMPDSPHTAANTLWKGSVGG